jgi:hypothetical protein
VVSDLSDHKFELSASNEEYTEKISYWLSLYLK